MTPEARTTITPASPKAILARTRRLVMEDLLACPQPLDDTANLFDAGLDSMAIMQLMLMLEEEFGVAIPVESVTRAQFGTLRAISDLVRERLGAEEEPAAELPGQETPAPSAPSSPPPAAAPPVFTTRALKNCDFFVLSFDAMMRERGEGGHVAHSVLELDSAPDAKALAAVLQHAAELYPMLSANVHKAWTFGEPQWEAGGALRVPALHLASERRDSPLLASALGGRFCEDAEAEVSRWINTPITAPPDAPDARLRLVLVEQRDGRAKLILSWSHLLVDGKGAELLLQALDSLHAGGACSIPALDEPGAPDTRHYGQLWQSARAMTWRFEALRKHAFDCLAPRDPARASGPLRYEVRVLDESATAAVKRRSRRFSEIVNLPFQLACSMRAHDEVFARRGRRPDSLMCSVPVQTRKKGAAGPLFQNHLVMFFGQCLRGDLETLDGTVASLAAQHQQFLREGLDKAFDDLMRMMRPVPSGLYLRFVNWRMKGLLNSFFHSDTGEFAPGLSSFLGARVATAYHIPGFCSPPGTGLFVNEKHGRLVLSLCWRGDAVNAAERAAMWQRWLDDLGANDSGA